MTTIPILLGLLAEAIPDWFPTQKQ